MKKYYKWTLEEEYSIYLPWLDKDYKFECEWGKVVDRMLTIYGGYSWNGCSPKFRIGAFAFGTWDGPVNPDTKKQWCYYASLVHDFLCQYKIGERSLADLKFFYMLEGFIFQILYYIVVRIAGWIISIYRNSKDTKGDK